MAATPSKPDKETKDTPKKGTSKRKQTPQQMKTRALQKRLERANKKAARLQQQQRSPVFNAPISIHNNNGNISGDINISDIINVSVQSAAAAKMEDEKEDVEEEEEEEDYSVQSAAAENKEEGEEEENNEMAADKETSPDVEEEEAKKPPAVESAMDLSFASDMAVDGEENADTQSKHSATMQLVRRALALKEDGDDDSSKAAELLNYLEGDCESLYSKTSSAIAAELKEKILQKKGGATNHSFPVSQWPGPKLENHEQWLENELDDTIDDYNLAAKEYVAVTKENKKLDDTVKSQAFSMLAHLAGIAELFNQVIAEEKDEARIQRLSDKRDKLLAMNAEFIRDSKNTFLR